MNPPSSSPNPQQNPYPAEPQQNPYPNYQQPSYQADPQQNAYPAYPQQPSYPNYQQPTYPTTPQQNAYPPYPQQAPYPTHYPQGNAPYINNNLAWGILATIFCCLPTGIYAIICSTQVDSLAAQGRIKEAQAKANEAMKWVKISAIVWASFAALYLILIIICVATA